MARKSRRATILESSWKVVAKSGVRNFRVEEVAAGADVSIGLVYYHFKDRDGLLRATMEHANQMTPAVPESDASGTGFELLRATLLADIGESALSRDNAVVWHELVAAAVFEEGIRPQVQASLDEWRESIARAVSIGQADGSIRSGLDPASVAAGLSALVDGLLSHVVLGSLSWSMAAEIVQRELDRAVAATTTSA